MRGRAAAVAVAVVGLAAGCKGDKPAPVAATVTARDAAAVDAAVVVDAVNAAAAIDAAAGSVALCPAITAVLAAQDTWFQALRGTGTGSKGLPLATVQLRDAEAVLLLRPDDRAGDWTARRKATPGLVEGWIVEAAACAPIADWAQLATSRTNHSWQRMREIAQLDHGVTTDRSLEVWIAGGKDEAWVTISVIDQETQPGD